jgi:pimeloyl-ACP methyl ester carboxylesterase
MQLYYQTYGEGHPLIILHGLLGSLENWHSLSKVFGEFFKVFAVDQRNHGRSPHSDVLNYPVMAEDIRELMQEQNLSSAHLLGHSMGAKTAMQLAVTYPERVDTLVVVDMAPRAYPPHHREIFNALYSLNLKSFKTRKDIDKALTGKIPDFSTRQFLLKNLIPDESGGFRWRMNLDAIYQNYGELLKGIETNRKFEKPTLFIKGGNSPYIQDEDLWLIRKIFPRAEIRVVEGVGHWVHVEAPREFSKIVLDFLEENSL